MQRSFSSLSRRAQAGACAAALSLIGTIATAATLPSGFSESTVASGISNATLMQIAPDGRVFVSQQNGTIRVIKNNTLLSTPFVQIQNVQSSNERGLQGIAFDPNYATNGYVYVYYTRSSPQNNIIGRLQSSPSNPDVAVGQPTVLMTIPNRGNIFHQGGGVQVGADGKLYVAVGDHQSGSGQNLNNLWGKVLRLNIPDGSIPSDNPFFNTSSGDNRAIWAYGFRNPFAMDIQPGTGRIFVDDAGDSASGGREEVNLLTRGGNFNWPNSQGPGSYFNYAASSQGGSVIVGGDFYNPTTPQFPPQYMGRYFFADYGGGWIRSINGSGGAGSLQNFASGIGSPTDVEVHPDGSMYYTTRGSSAVRRITFGNPPITPTPTPTPRVTPTPTPTATPGNTPTPTPTTEPGECVEATGVTATASTNDGNVPANVLDNNLATRWSGNGDGATLDLDLGQTQRVCFVRIAFYRGNERQARFDLQRSPGGGPAFLDIVTGVTSSGTTLNEETFDFPDTPARIVRFVGHGNTANMFNSVTEVSVFVRPGGGEPDPTPTPTATTRPVTPTPTPTPTPTSDPTECGEATGVTASASTNDGNVPANVLDNNLATRWSGNGDGATLDLDLGSTRTVCSVRIAWYRGNERQAHFTLQAASGPGGPFTTILPRTTSSGTTLNEETYDFPDTSARVIRYLGHGNTANLFNSVTEVSVLVRGGAPEPTPTPTPTPTGGPTPTPTPTRIPGGDSPVAINGQLRVCGTKLCNQYGNPIQLRGMSTHGLQWHYDCYNNASMDALRNDWGADMIRVSQYVQEGGWSTNPTEFNRRADTIIQMAVDRGMYANIDWHQLSPGDPMVNLNNARQYFTHMASKWGHLPNVTYEICNEPSGVSWSRIREYAHAIIPTIRNIDPDGVILVGTEDWSSLGMSGSRTPTSGTDAIRAAPVNFPNLMYVFHFYAASHTGEYRQALSYAADNIPMFVTEWGTQTYTGGGGNDFNSSQQYVDLMRAKKISWTNWNYSDDPLSGAAFTEGTCPSGPYAGTSRTKPAGAWIRERIRTPPDDFPTE